MKKRLEGIVTPVVTPLLENGGVDRVCVGKHLDFLIERGIAGIFVLGTTGEGPALPDFVRKDMIVTAAAAVAGRVPLLAGISAASLEESLELARFAAAHGADYAVAAPPCYLPLEESELFEFYRILTMEQPLPLFLYNMPAMTKIEMSPELVIRIASLPGVAGYKDSSGNFPAFEQTVASLATRGDFSFLMGPDTQLSRALAAGACGGVNSGSNIAPEFFVGLYRAHCAGDSAAVTRFDKEIANLQKIYQFRENICCGVAAGLKYGLSCMGLCKTPLTRPAAPLTRNAVIDDFVAHYTKLYGSQA